MATYQSNTLDEQRNWTIASAVWHRAQLIEAGRQLLHASIDMDQGATIPITDPRWLKVLAARAAMQTALDAAERAK